MQDFELAINEFINKMNYINNKEVIGIVFYGSYLTGISSKYSDIDLHIIKTNVKPDILIRGAAIINGFRIEYFEKPIKDLYLSADNDFKNQSNAIFNIIGKAKVLFDRYGEIYKLQNYILEKYLQPLPILCDDDIFEKLSILENRMDKLYVLYEQKSINFIHMYHLTVEKIRKFYHQILGISDIPTSKVIKIYTNNQYAEAMSKNIPDKTFISLYIDAISDNQSSTVKLKKIQKLYEYIKHNKRFDNNNHRIYIKSRNK